MTGWIFVLLALAYIIFGIGNELIAKIIIGIAILAFGIIVESMRNKINEQKQSIDKLIETVEKLSPEEKHKQKTE